MNNQEILNIVYPALMKQGKKSQSSSGSCQYFGPNNCKRAVGHLIPDDYKDRMTDCNEFGISHSKVGPLLDEVLGPYSWEFLRELQALHDNTPVDEWQLEFKKLSGRWTLTLPQLIDVKA